MVPLPEVSVTEKDRLRKRLLETVLRSRFSDFYVVKGKDRGREACHLVLVDMNKKQRFLEQQAAGTMEVTDYGIVLESAWGHEAPPFFEDRVAQFQTDIIQKLVCVKIRKDFDQHVYYTLSDVEREDDFITAASEEQVREIGTILYSTRDEDPAESFCSMLEKAYFGLAEHRSTSPDELFDSVRNGHLHRVSAYLDEGGDANTTDEHGLSLMHHAALSGNVDLVEYLKVHGANVHAADKMCGRKPIHIAAKEVQPEVIAYFLRNEVDVNARDQMDWTPLHYAVWAGHLYTVRFLVEHSADVNAKDVNGKKAPIHIATEHGYDDIIEYLKDNGANIETED